jgi:hypothetical protein
MSLIARADANGAGSSAAGTTADSTAAAKRTRGPADGPNTIWSKAPKQVAEGPKGSVNFNKIDGILKDLQIQEMRFVAANNEYADAQRKNSSEKAQKKETYDKVKNDYLSVQIKLGEAIEAETKRLSRPSSISRTGSDLRDSRDVRRLENAILDHAKLSSQQGPVQDAILENRRLRAPRELSELSAKMGATVLKPNQTKEQENILADAKDFVSGIRPEDKDLTPAEITKKRLDRLEELLRTVTTREDPSTRQIQKFNSSLYTDLINKIRLSIDDNTAVDALTKKYSGQGPVPSPRDQGPVLSPRD